MRAFPTPLGFTSKQNGGRVVHPDPQSESVSGNGGERSTEGEELFRSHLLSQAD